MAGSRRIVCVWGWAGGCRARLTRARRNDGSRTVLRFNGRQWKLIREDGVALGVLPGRSTPVLHVVPRLSHGAAKAARRDEEARYDLSL